MWSCRIVKINYVEPLLISQLLINYGLSAVLSSRIGTDNNAFYQTNELKLRSPLHLMNLITVMILALLP